MANLVVVADLIRGFMEEGYPLYLGPKAREIIPNVRKLLESEKQRGSHIIFLADNHEPDDREFEMFPRHCVKGTVETEVIPELADLATEIIPKTRYSGFYGTTLGQRLDEIAPTKVIMCGVCTDICVLHTTADFRDRDYSVEVPADCVATFDDEAHNFALKHIEKVLGAKVTHVAAAR
jgi:nicotinamidase-related amidase